MVRPLLVLGLAAALLSWPLHATDMAITFNVVRTEAEEGGASHTEIRYYSEDYQLTRGVESLVDQLVDLHSGTSYTIDHKKGVISKLAFEDLMAMMEALNRSLSQGMSGPMADLLGDPRDSRVESLGTAQVAGRNCQVWRITVGRVTMVLSADPSLRTPGPETGYSMLMQARAAQMAKAGPMGAFYQRLSEEMEKVQGIPLETHLTGPMNVNTATEATRIDFGPIPAATFALPRGYRVEDLGEKIRKALAGSR
jgi:hypothetical protein